MSGFAMWCLDGHTVSAREIEVKRAQAHISLVVKGDGPAYMTPDQARRFGEAMIEMSDALRRSIQESELIEDGDDGK